MCKTIIALLLSVVLVLSGCGKKEQGSEHPTKTEHPSSEQAKPAEPNAKQPASEHPTSEHPTSEHPK